MLLAESTGTRDHGGDVEGGRERCVQCCRFYIRETSSISGAGGKGEDDAGSPRVPGEPEGI